MENTSYYDSSYSPNEACEVSDVPACSNCADTGVIEKGYDVRSTLFCDCEEGEQMFCVWADAEGSMADEQLRGWGIFIIRSAATPTR